MADDINVRVSYDQPEPPPKKRHYAWDVIVIVFACALIGTAAGSGAIFAIVCAIALGLYVVGNIKTDQPQQ